jgi:hypothetical protein
MTSNAYQLSLSFEQVLKLVKQLPDTEKLRLNQELEKDIRERTMTQLLEDFQTDEITAETIDQEVEAVRSELYAKRKAH